ncbi:MAG: aspartate-semialdehyde dehydrogenase [Deltaproteobacteria bacterium]|nr:aspartate-semialdehyde dehydrogenase [Deltaproteobacteria bacterium]
MTIDVAILGATGMVGQRFVQLLSAHPEFRVAEICASDRSAGKRYAEAATWRLEGDNPLADRVVLPCDPAAVRSRVVFSALDSSAARSIEPAFRDAGKRVLTNASPFRMSPEVPLLVPEVNPEHAELVRGRDGYIVANPNCTHQAMVIALAPLHQRWGVEAVCCASYQAVSGAGYPGESAWDMLGNVHPHPGDEEEKVASEPRKILSAPDLRISARCVRVPVADGHLVAVQAKLRHDPGVDAIVEAMRSFAGPVPLPSSPRPLIHVLEGRDRPTPRQDAMRGGGMAVTVARVEPCEVHTVKFFALAHNAIRGAAGGAIANAELLRARGLLG